tara:strand:+ start:255 stop:1337 length:1083 start_codon:yes stop_codon:yes gene_type:complete
MSIDKKIDYVNQDGYKNYIKDSKSVTVPVKFKSKKDATPTKLAYITADEAKMLKKMKKNTPHKGPSGIPSYDDYDASKGDYGTATSGEQMSGFESGAKGERSRADARSLGMSPKDVRDIRGGALKAGAGQTVNPGLFGPRNRPGVNVRRGPKFGMNLIGGLMSLINPALGFFMRGVDFFQDKLQDLRGYNPDGTPMSQEDYEKARLERQLTSRLDNLYDRKLTGKNYSQKNIDMLEAMGVTTSKGNIKSAIDRDIAMNPEMPQFATSYIQNLAQPNINRFSNTVAPMGVNVPSTGIKTIDVGYGDPAFDNTLSADATYDQQKNVLENILNTEDTGVGEFIEDKEQKDKRQQELLNEIMLG